MRIGFYAPLKPPDHPAPSGDRRIARLFMQVLADLGHRVDIVSTLRSYNRKGDSGHESETVAAAATEVERLSAAWQADPATRPDLLFTYHVYHKAADYLCPALKRRFNLPYVIAEPSVAPKREHGPWAAGYRQAALAIRAADILLPITELDRVCLSAFAGADKVQVFPPFLDHEPFAAAADARGRQRVAATRLYGLEPEKPWLLAVGMMRAGDKIASFLRLAEMLKLGMDAEWQILLVGDGPERKTAEQAFAFAGNRARFTGQLDSQDLPGLYAACDLYVWPAINEAYGMALLEAQAAGLPVLSVRTRGVPDVVRHGETGWLAMDDRPETLAAALRGILGDKELRRSMAATSIRHVAAHLSMTAARQRLSAAFAPLGLPA
jgi:glycosyltransferase involved in cell wall biosynthesis